MTEHLSHTYTGFHIWNCYCYWSGEDMIDTTLILILLMKWNPLFSGLAGNNVLYSSTVCNLTWFNLLGSYQLLLQWVMLRHQRVKFPLMLTQHVLLLLIQKVFNLVLSTRWCLLWCESTNMLMFSMLAPTYANKHYGWAQKRLGLLHRRKITRHLQPFRWQEEGRGTFWITAALVYKFTVLNF